VQDFPSLFLQLQRVENKELVVGSWDEEHPHDILVAFPPSRYLEKSWYCFWRCLYCESSHGVLGANFMSGHGIHFDMDSHHIGFAERASARHWTTIHPKWRHRHLKAHWRCQRTIPHLSSHHLVELPVFGTNMVLFFILAGAYFTSFPWSHNEFPRKLVAGVEQSISFLLWG
jgi:hypothetical protein